MKYEDYYQKQLKNWLIKKKDMDFVSMRNKLNKITLEGKIKSENKELFPDIVSYSKSENSLYIIECKKGRRLTRIGHLFGQLLAQKLAFDMVKLDYIKKINAYLREKEEKSRNYRNEKLYWKKSVIIHANCKVILGVGYPKYKNMYEGSKKLFEKFTEYIRNRDKSFKIFYIFNSKKVEEC